MGFLLGLLLFSWFFTSLLYVPFIQLLYRWRFQRLKQKTLDAFDKRTPIFDRFHQKKAGTPVGGGLLIIVLVTLLFPLTMLIMKYFWIPITSVYPMMSEIKILLFTFLSFGILGLLDDAKKTFMLASSGFFGLRLRHKLIFEIMLASIIGFWLVHDLKIDIFYIPFVGIIHMGWVYVLMAILVIIAFANAYNITDGLDGLASGVLLVSLVAFWVISASILDSPLSVFIALWLGGLLAFMYFNVFPARIFLGDVGALSFGATLAVVALILGKAPALVIIGGIFVIEVASSFLQLFWKQYFGRKLFSAAPLHLWLQHKGWPEPKIVMRFWILSVVFAIFGLWLSILKV